MWAQLGRIISWCIRPFIRRMIDGSTRARVAVIHDGKVLLIKDWLGNQEWSLPGGGLEGDETIEQAAVRELYEETFVSVGIDEVRHLKTVLVQSNEGVTYNAALCVVQLEQPVEPSAHWPEVMGFAWFSLSDIPSGSDPLIQMVINLIKHER